MNAMTKRTLALSGGPGSYTVTLDGVDVSQGLRNLTIEADPRNHGPVVTAELKIDAVEVTNLSVREPDFLLSMPEEAKDALIALGWTPPAGERPRCPGQDHCTGYNCPVESHQ